MKKVLRINIVLDIIIGILNIILGIKLKNYWQLITGFTFITMAYLINDNIRLMKQVETELEINNVCIENYNSLVEEYIKNKE